MLIIFNNYGLFIIINYNLLLNNMYNNIYNYKLFLTHVRLFSSKIKTWEFSATNEAETKNF